MNTAALITAVMLTGCAAQPAYQPANYTQPTPVPQANREDACLITIIRTNAFNKVATPILKKCNRGDDYQCQVFAMFYEKASEQLNAPFLQRCFEDHVISVNHKENQIFRREAPEFIRQANIFTRTRGY